MVEHLEMLCVERIDDEVVELLLSEGILLLIYMQGLLSDADELQ